MERDTYLENLRLLNAKKEQRIVQKEQQTLSEYRAIQANVKEKKIF